MQDGAPSDDTRLRATLPTVTELADRGAIVLLLAHFGRPKGQRSPDLSLALLTRPYAALLGREVRFVDWDGAEQAVASLNPGDIALLENTRFFAGEEKNDPQVIDRMAKLGELYVNDAFSAAHRAHASTEGLAHRLPAFAGRQMEAELDALEQALGSGGGGRREGVDQTRCSQTPGREGRSPHNRRRHGQHLPRRARGERRQEPVRA